MKPHSDFSFVQNCHTLQCIVAVDCLRKSWAMLIVYIVPSLKASICSLSE